MTIGPESIFRGGSGERKKKNKKPDIEDVCVPLGQIQKIAFKRARWSQSKLTLFVNDLRALEHIPGGMGTRLVLRIDKEHADLADSFVSSLHLKLSEQTLRRLDDHLGTVP